MEQKETRRDNESSSRPIRWYLCRSLTICSVTVPLWGGGLSLSLSCRTRATRGYHDSLSQPRSPGRVAFHKNTWRLECESSGQVSLRSPGFHSERQHAARRVMLFTTSQHANDPRVLRVHRPQLATPVPQRKSSTPQTVTCHAKVSTKSWRLLSNLLLNLRFRVILVEERKAQYAGTWTQSSHP